MRALFILELVLSQMFFALLLKLHKLTSNSVFNFPLHLEGVHINGPVSNDSCTRNSPVWLTEPIFMVIFSAKDRLGFYKQLSSCPQRIFTKYILIMEKTQKTKSEIFPFPRCSFLFRFFLSTLKVLMRHFVNSLLEKEANQNPRLI